MKKPKNLSECFYFDDHELNPKPKSLIDILIRLTVNNTSRYTMPLYMRIAQVNRIRYDNANNRFLKLIYLLLFKYFCRKNQIKNNFEHGSNPKIEAGVVFHHSGVTITGKTLIEKGVHIYRNVTFGGKDGGAPHIKELAKICTNAVIIGPVSVGRESIVAPGSVVIHDVPDKKIVSGIPAKIIGDVNEKNYNF
jgi:serine O-acetyltransferase